MGNGQEDLSAQTIELGRILGAFGGIPARRILRHILTLLNEARWTYFDDPYCQS
jgi:hypothetical protein